MAHRFAPGLKRTPKAIPELDHFLEGIRCIADHGHALHLEEKELGILCIAIPVRNGSSWDIAAVSIGGTLMCIGDRRIERLIPLVQGAAQRSLQELEWNDTQQLGAMG